MSTAAARPAPSLTDQVQFLPGVGPKRAAALERMGIRTCGDLLYHLPHRHERNEARTIIHLDFDTTATIVGRITAVRTEGRWRGGRTTATLIDNTGRCSLVWFSAPWMADKIHRGDIVRVSGRVTEYQRLPQLVNPKIAVLGADAPPVDESAPARFEAVYPASQELPAPVIAKLIHTHLDRLLSLVHDPLPPEHLKRRGLVGLAAALRGMHRPRSDGESIQARKRLAYDELLLLQLAVGRRRATRAGDSARPLPSSPEIDARIRRRFPFSLTPGQDRAIRAVTADLARRRPMHRLLQGDVGCGKTIVAVYAALVAVANRSQAAIMAPTELLAEQHMRSITRYLEGSRVRFARLTGGLRKADRAAILRALADGEIDLVVGTHALIQGDVKFKQLGLVIIDEQHRFGVRQRAVLRQKGLSPHYLVMTATPIPRTLAMTVFGDLDVTTIQGMPPGRSPIQTRVVTPVGREAAWLFVKQRLAAGEQAYVVYPVIDESDTMQIRAASREFQQLAREVFPDRAVGLLHGRLAADERDRVMKDFLARRIDVLVATTVIEVGIDVPNATVMAIEHAERYGLSQLHQLRGRIGRGDAPGTCLLMTDSRAAADNERLRIMESTQDGFKIAEEDLRLRGPGELIGARQHGLPALHVADLIGDAELLRLAQQDADELLRNDPPLARPAHAALRAALHERHRDALQLVHTG
ncbi:ATP-dependent DNA helicase RecG [Phycisphaerae bacterium RAS2]|nr:ATP-dependent DNA helicase RecG [Phycisphaerae bacterium RAS2]